MDIAHATSGAGISSLFDHYRIPSDFISQRLESVTHSFGAVKEESNYCTNYSPLIEKGHTLNSIDSFFHFLCKNVTINGIGGQSSIADPRGTALSQGDWTWIRTSVFMRWRDCNDKSRATVTLIIFSCSPELRDRCQRLWQTDLSMVLMDPFSLFVICLDELWLQAQDIVRNVGGAFNNMERVSLNPE